LLRTCSILLVLACLAAGPAAWAAGATLTIIFTRQGEPLEDMKHAKFYLYEPEKREQYIAWGHGGKSARFPEGSYDLVIRYKNDLVQREFVREEVDFAGETVEEVDFPLDLARLTIDVFAGKDPLAPHTGRVSIHRAGKRGKPLAARRPGSSYVLPPGFYDIEVSVRDLRGLRSTWLENYRLSEDQIETIELGAPPARVTITLVREGRPLPQDQTRWQIYPAGQRERPLLERHSEESADLTAGDYDIALIYDDGRSKPVVQWIENLPLHGAQEHRFEISRESTSLRVDIDTGGSSTEGSWFVVRRPDTPTATLAQGRSGESIDLPPGRYDIGAFLHRDGLRDERWQRGVRIGGESRQRLRLDPRPATLRINPPRRSRRNSTKPIAPTLMLVVDSSATMDPSRLELLRRVVPDALRDARRAEFDVGLRAFGIAPADRQDCTDSSLLQPVRPLDADGTRKTLQLLRASGRSPLAHTLQQLEEDLPEGDGNTVVLLTGSVEDCGGAPCEEVSRLIRRGVVDRIHVLAIDMSPDATRSLGCIGNFTAVRSERQLRSALRQILRDAARPEEGTVSLFTPDWGEWIASARLGQELDISAGSYDLLIRHDGKTYLWERVEIRGEFEATAASRRPR